MKKGEDDLIRWIAQTAAGRRESAGDDAASVGIGDDMAVLRLGGETLLVAADMLMDGVHFDSRVHAPIAIGRKALAVNLSDCAAMAVRPWCALVSVALPDGWSMDMAQSLFSSLSKLAAEFDCRIVGGDTNSWDKPLAIDVMILARPWDGIAPVLRSGARIGDGVFVTGRLGGSRAGRHMTFNPRVADARRIAAALGSDLHAMMDLSDGLSTDAPRLAAASDVGIEFEFDALLGVADAVVAKQGIEPADVVRSVVGDGEDFELLFCSKADAVRRVGSALAISITRIGTVVEERGIRLHMPDGSLRDLEPTGWQHFQ